MSPASHDPDILAAYGRTVPGAAYLDPVRDEITRLRAANALLEDTLRKRTAALQRVIDRPCPNCANSEDAP